MDLTRSIEVFNPKLLEDDVHVIGVGATGSFVVQTLVRFGVSKINIYDNDKYEIHNVNNQAILQKHCERDKVEVTAEICKEINPDVEIIEHKKFVNADDIKSMSGYVFVLVDSMKSRQELFGAIKNNKNIKHYWESRLGSDQGRVYCMPIEENYNYETYENMHFYSDEEAEVSACGTSITIVSIVLGVTSLMINQFIKIIMNTQNVEPYINHFTLFDSMFGVYTENFREKVATVENIDDLIL